MPQTDNTPQTGREPRNPEQLPKDGPPGRRPAGRGWREGDPQADSVVPGREFGAGGQVDDGPDETAGAGAGGS